MYNALITTQMLKSYGLSLLNRGEDGFGKQGVFGGVNRARISSACLKKAIRSAGIFNESIRTSHLEDLIEKILLQKLEAGEISEKEIKDLAPKICKALDCKWEKRSSAAEVKKAKKKDDDKSSEENNGKGRTVVVATKAEILAIIDAIIQGKSPKRALDNIQTPADKAMFGTMTTNGELESIDGAVQMGQSFSIDEYIPESDFIAATFEGSNIADDDPFYGSFNSFSEERKALSGSETIADSWMNANVMFTPSCINVKELECNLSQSVTHKKLSDTSEDVLIQEVTDCVDKYLRNLPITDPSAKQNSCSTHPAPAIYYLEFIKDGNCQYTDFEKVIRKKQDKGIAEQGIEKILQFSQDNTFRTGQINRYVMLSAPYQDYADRFSRAGVKVIKSFDELSAIIKDEVRRILI